MLHGRCAICGESRYATLNVHRWKTEGKDGGEYTEGNSVVLCNNHHNLVHAKEILILGTFESTNGKVIIFIDENGYEQIHNI